MPAHTHEHPLIAPAEVLDPVCGMTISPDDAVGHVDYKGQTYYFCSQSCIEQFRATPEAFLGDRSTPATPADMEREYTCPMDPEVRQKGPGACPKCGMALEPVDVAPVTKTQWTCPMHPEIVRDAPGACPICGMALEPRVVTIEESNPELDDMTRRFWWSSAITIPMLAFMISEFLPGRPLQTLLPHGWMNWIQLALATPVVLWGGWPFFVRGWASVVNRHLNMFTLIALGVGAAYAFSVIATLAPGVFPDSFRIMGEVAVYFEPAAVIVVLVLLGQVLELRARSRTSSAIRNLLGLAPKTARRIEADRTERDVPLSDVHVGERLRV
ncbi:MAG TPA: heavy metal-binding domain-containing protein, partial [Vicinamibacterales bacterium]|nr:heavy metal-binding domain-containing protein [Vicinamibacterales bacterium]